MRSPFALFSIQFSWNQVSTGFTCLLVRLFFFALMSFETFSFRETAHPSEAERNLPDFAFYTFTAIHGRLFAIYFEFFSSFDTRDSHPNETNKRVLFGRVFSPVSSDVVFIRRSSVVMARSTLFHCWTAICLVFRKWVLLPPTHDIISDVPTAAENYKFTTNTVASGLHTPKMLSKVKSSI